MKAVNIKGTSTRYSMQQIIRDEPSHIHQPVPLKSPPTLRRKRDSYLHQDKLKDHYLPEKFVTLEFISHALKSCDMKCFYCHEITKSDYTHARDMRQWTLDRKDNALGHNTDNVVVACLQCNLKRRNIGARAFFAEKNLVLIKLSPL